MFSTLVLYFSTCNNLFNSGNRQERLVDNINLNSSEFRSEAKRYFLGGFAEGEGSVSASLFPIDVVAIVKKVPFFQLT
jgi:hypothetical protein